MILAFVGLVPATADASRRSNLLKAEAYNLAVIDAAGTPTRSEVRQYVTSLKSLTEKCTEGVRRVGAYARETWRIVNRKGVDATLLYVLDQVNLSMPAGLGRTRCRDIFAAWATLAKS